MPKDAINLLVSRVGSGFALVTRDYSSVENWLLELLNLYPLPEVVLRIDRIISSSPIVLLWMASQGLERLVVFLLFHWIGRLSLEAWSIARSLVQDVVRLFHFL